MIGVLLDERVGLPRKEVLREDVGVDGVFHAFCTEEGQWIENGGQAPIGLASFVGGRFARPPGTNWFYLLWRAADERLFDVLSFFARQTIERRVAVILLGPVEAESVREIQGRLITLAMPGAVWAVGKETTDRQPVSSDQRLAVARAILGGLDYGGEKTAEALNVDSGFEKDSPWCFLGCLSLLPIPQDTRDLQRRLVQAVLKKQIEENLKGQTQVESVRNAAEKPEVEVKEILTFGLGSRFGPDQWPDRFPNVFEGWRCSLLRWRAEHVLHGTLDRDHIALMKYVARLREELALHSAEIRREGRELQTQRSAGLRAWLESCSSLSSLALLLEHYFPKFRELDLQVGNRDKTPCSPCGSASEDFLKREFVTVPKDLLGRHGSRLFNRVGLLVWALCGLAAIGFACRLWFADVKPDLVGLVVCLWAIPMLVRFVMAFMASRRLQRELKRDRMERIESLHHAFATKIERVKELTRKTVALHFISLNRRVGDRLGRLFGSFFGGRVEVEQADRLPELREIAYKLQQAGISNEKLESARRRVADLGTEIVRKSLEGEDQHIDLETVFRDFERGTGGATAGPGAVRTSETQAEFENQWDTGIPLFARFGTQALQTGLVRLTFLPSASDYDEFAQRVRRQRLGIGEDSRFFRVPVPAPVVIRMKAISGEDGIRAALEMTEIQQ